MIIKDELYVESVKNNKQTAFEKNLNKNKIKQKTAIECKELICCKFYVATYLSV